MTNGLTWRSVPQLRRKRQRPIGDFGRLLRSHRERLGISMNQLARQIPMDQGLLSKVENGKRPPPQLVPHVQRIAAALGLKDDSAEFKELFEIAYRERFGKKESWPSIVSVVLSERGQPELVRTPVVPRGLSGYAPPETHETIHPDSPLGRRFSIRSDEEIQQTWGPILTPEVAIPCGLREILSKSTEGLWVQQMLVGLANLGVTLTQFTRKGDHFTLDFRLPDGREYAVSASPKEHPNRRERHVSKR